MDALYGLIGPATRKAVFESIKDLLQSFNTALESAFTLKGIKWRIESISTGRPYSEVVMIHSIIYKVEQVFLIHKESGLLLQHVKAADTVIQDEDMVSGMLKAIQDFVHDSFNLDSSESLNTLDIGSTTVWIEESPYAVLAAVIRGNAPETLKRTFIETLERIHKDYKQNLKSFDGDTGVFEPSRGDLTECLKSRVRTEKKKTPVFAWAVLGVIAIAFILFSYFQISSIIRWNDYIENLQAEPGIVILEEERNLFSYEIKGLKDPYAADPADMLDEFDISAENVAMSWQNYISTDSQIVLQKAKRILNVPDNIKIAYHDGILSAEGKAGRKWKKDAEQAVMRIPGIIRYDFEKVHVIENDIILELVTKIEACSFNYIKNKTVLTGGQENKIDSLALWIKKLRKLAKDETVVIEITGHTDSSGGERANDLLSWNRAKSFMELLVQSRKLEGDFTLKGIGYKNPLVQEKSEDDMQLNRRVNINVKFVSEREN